MRKTSLSLLAVLVAAFVFGQEPAVKIKKEKLYVNDTAICIIDKKKKGMLSEPSFEIRSLDDKLLATAVYKSVDAPVSRTLYWYELTPEGGTDKIQLNYTDFSQYGKKLFDTKDEAIGKMIARFGVIKNGAIVPEGWAALKAEHGNDYATEYIAKAGKEKVCMDQIKGAGKSDAAKPVLVSFVRTDTATKNTAHMIFDILQDNVKIGTIVASGFPKSVKEDDAEYDYSPGLASLDFKSGGPMNYEITNADGCILARYNGEERFLGTWKDGVQTKMGDLKKYNKDGVKSRLAYMQAIANFLVQRKYL